MTAAHPRAIAVVPLRDGVSGKSRLAAVLDPDARRRLVRVLARHVVRALLSAEGIERVLVVTADPAFTREALSGLEAPRLEVIEQPADRPGLNPALEHAREVLAAAPASPGAPPPPRLLVAHADLPALTPQDVSAILAAEGQVVVATDRTRSGTNLLLLPGGADTRFTFRFGPDSLASHLDEARRVGMTATVIDRPGTAVDLDTTQDWSQLPEGVRAAVREHVRSLP